MRRRPRTRPRRIPAKTRPLRRPLPRTATGTAAGEFPTRPSARKASTLGRTPNRTWWWLQTAEFLRPLYTLAVQVVLASHVIHTDDTPVKVRDAYRKQKHTGRFWP